MAEKRPNLTSCSAYLTIHDDVHVYLLCLFNGAYSSDLPHIPNKPTLDVFSTCSESRSKPMQTKAAVATNRITSNPSSEKYMYHSFRLSINHMKHSCRLSLFETASTNAATDTISTDKMDIGLGWVIDEF